MGVKFNREYSDIINDIVLAMSTMEDCHLALEMERQEWTSLPSNERSEYLRTLADDIFYGLGTEPLLEFGRGTFRYEPNKHTIRITTGDQIVHVIHLI